MGKALLHTPGQYVNQLGLLGAGAVVVIAHVEQAALIGIGRRGRSKAEGQIDRRYQTGTVELQRVKGTGLDERLHAALVQARALDSACKVKQALERSSLLRGSAAFTRGHNGVDGLMARAKALAADMATKAPISLQLTKQLVNAATGEDRDAVLEAMAGALAASTQDAAEGIASFKEKRKAAYRGR